MRLTFIISPSFADERILLKICQIFPISEDHPTVPPRWPPLRRHPPATLEQTPRIRSRRMVLMAWNGRLAPMRPAHLPKPAQIPAGTRAQCANWDFTHVWIGSSGSTWRQEKGSTLHNLEQLSGHELACSDGWLYKYDGCERSQDKKGCDLSTQSADNGDKAKAASIDGEIRSGINGLAHILPIGNKYFIKNTPVHCYYSSTLRTLLVMSLMFRLVDSIFSSRGPLLCRKKLPFVENAAGTGNAPKQNIGLAAFRSTSTPGVPPDEESGPHFAHALDEH